MKYLLSCFSQYPRLNCSPPGFFAAVCALYILMECSSVKVIFEFSCSPRTSRFQVLQNQSLQCLSECLSLCVCLSLCLSLCLCLSLSPALVASLDEHQDSLCRVLSSTLSTVFTDHQIKSKLKIKTKHKTNNKAKQQKNLKLRIL